MDLDLSNSALTGREYAYFAATGFEDPAFVTQALKLDPTKCLRFGEEWTTSTGQILKRRLSVWNYPSGLPDTEDVGRHIDVILNRLSSRQGALKEVQAHFKTQIVCVSTSGNFSFETTLQQQRLASELGLTFWFDIYPNFDPHEEIQELRSLLVDPTKGTGG